MAELETGDVQTDDGARRHEFVSAKMQTKGGMARRVIGAAKLQKGTGHLPK